MFPGIPELRKCPTLGHGSASWVLVLKTQLLPLALVAERVQR